MKFKEAKAIQAELKVKRSIVRTSEVLDTIPGGESRAGEDSRTHILRVSQKVQRLLKS